MEIDETKTEGDSPIISGGFTMWYSDCERNFNAWKDIHYSNNDGSAPEGCDDDDIFCRIGALAEEDKKQRLMRGETEEEMRPVNVRMYMPGEWKEFTLGDISNCEYEDFECMHEWVIMKSCHYLPTGHNLFNKCIARTLFYNPPCKNEDTEC